MNSSRQSELSDATLLFEMDVDGLIMLIQPEFFISLWILTIFSVLQNF